MVRHWIAGQLLVGLVLCDACSDATGITDGPLTVQRRQETVELSNASDAPLHYFILEREIAARVDWVTCAGPACRAVPPLGSVSVPNSQILGYSPAAREVLVYWWRGVSDGQGGLRAGRIRHVVVPL
jgi:hypothetical protein